MGFAQRGLDLKDALLEIEEGHVERAPTEIEDERALILALLVQAAGDGRRRGLVNYAEAIEADDGGRVLMA